jgi:assimilatory nitrate reductase electron transfer subunit
VTDVPRRIVIVGHGLVGARFVEEVRRRDPTGERASLAVFGAESVPPTDGLLAEPAELGEGAA